MPSYSRKSTEKLNTCHDDIRRVFLEVINHFDCTILEGHRGLVAQNKAYTEGKSQLKWPDGKHNKTPSIAVDAIPYPIDWGDRERMGYFAGWVLGTASRMGIKLRWGGDWDMDTQVKDNSFDDLVHFELIV